MIKFAYKANGLDNAFIAVTTSLAMIAFSAFPLAFFLNRPYFWHGLVSGLSEKGQPYSELFTAIDIAASLFGILFFGYLAWHQKKDGTQRTVLGLVVVASLAELLTDIFRLPDNFPTVGGIPSAHYFAAHPSLIVHLSASFLNSTAFLVSFGLWVVHRHRTKAKSITREVIFASALCISVAGGVIGRIYPVLSPTLQRMFILCYCYWFIALPYDSLAVKRRRGSY